MIKNKNTNFSVSAPSEDVAILTIHGNGPNAAWVIDRLDDVSLSMPDLNSVVIASRNVDQPELSNNKWLHRKYEPRVSEVLLQKNQWIRPQFDWFVIRAGDIPDSHNRLDFSYNVIVRLNFLNLLILLPQPQDAILAPCQKFLPLIHSENANTVLMTFEFIELLHVL